MAGIIFMAWNTITDDHCTVPASYLDAVDDPATVLPGDVVADPHGDPRVDAAVVHAHDEGIWSARRTFGDVPPETSGAAAEVIGDFLFVACGMVRGSTEMCV